MQDLLAAADWKAAEQAGQVAPVSGIEPVYDDAVSALKHVDDELNALLRGFKEIVGEAVFVSMNKDTHVLEVPEAAAKRVPRDYNAMSARKGFKRYSCEDLEGLVAERKRAVEAVEAAQVQCFFCFRRCIDQFTPKNVSFCHQQ